MECPKDKFDCRMSIPKQTVKQILTVYYTGVSKAICHHKASLVKAPSHAYCQEGLFCALILTGEVTYLIKYDSEDGSELRMCDLFAESKQSCNELVTRVTDGAGGQCPNVNNPCHSSEECDSRILGAFRCHCDPFVPPLVDVGDACVNGSIWQGVGITIGGIHRSVFSRFPFRAVHLAPTVMAYPEAREYCQSIGGVLPNYFTYEVERLINTISPSLLQTGMYWLAFRDDENNVWIDQLTGKVVTLSNWGPNDPNGFEDENCVAYLTSNNPLESRNKIADVAEYSTIDTICYLI
ncbi:uncharacterized protein LOC142349586 [Convolutriloba macropyga]|uniref:uncharacterized protein LOC142349586 n=1 Tax=Convolutriloba macropyga TaxID=536237 RepID=UPI003F51E206